MFFVFFLIWGIYGVLFVCLFNLVVVYDVCLMPGFRYYIHSFVFIILKDICLMLEKCFTALCFMFVSLLVYLFIFQVGDLF